MCLFSGPSRPPVVKPPAPPPPAPAPPPAPKPLPNPTTLETEEETKPNVKYGRKKKDATRARSGRTSDGLRIPLNNPSPGGQTGGLNA